MLKLFNFNGATSVTVDMPNLPRGTAPLTPNANGQALIDIGVYPIEQLLARGLSLATPTVAATANRPTTNLSPGMPFFDSTLNIPVWRDATNTVWINAAGTTV